MAKRHRYRSVVENRRLRAGRTTQRTVLYLGEINDTRQAAWRKSLDALTALIHVGVAVALKRTTGPAGRRISAPQLDRGRPGGSLGS